MSVSYKSYAGLAAIHKSDNRNNLGTVNINNQKDAPKYPSPQRALINEPPQIMTKED
jgi:hypothetical protein